MRMENVKKPQEALILLASGDPIMAFVILHADRTAWFFRYYHSLQISPVSFGLYAIYLGVLSSVTECNPAIVLVLSTPTLRDDCPQVEQPAILSTHAMGVSHHRTLQETPGRPTQPEKNVPNSSTL
ncbi:hypothetical protein DFP72DRAFT_855651 [Ephemerocybe angulata]|uniref:Uncharacterized protein n=1 Tax=Ephemerocybe angulata TaxID=980116 RepID=A0A8H6HH23_9AGAR|nr:hypothetical protein DFP72DRAFT_855651 [Tulosesus angulatus]